MIFYSLLNELSSDAAPVVLEWAEGISSYRYEEHMRERVGDITIRNFNVSRAQADLLLVRMNK